MPRRTLGEGSLTFRKDGRWQGSLQRDGTRRTVYGATRAEAWAKLEALREQYPAGSSLPERHTLGELLDTWLTTGEGRWKPRTLANYRSDAEVWRQTLGPSLPLAKLSPSRLQTILNRVASKRRAQQLHQAIHAALALAVRFGWLATNPADRVIRPTVRRTDRAWWTIDQCGRFLEATEPSRWWPLWALALATGLREGELLALRWQDVAGDILHVERAGQFVDGTWTEVSPKTASGRRAVPLNALAREALRRQRTQQAEWRLRCGPTWTDPVGRIFTTEQGRPLRRFDVAKVLRQTVADAGLPPLTLHGLRHLAGSLALHSGVPLPVVSRLLGHSHVGITASVYAHVLADVRPATEGIARALGR